jgi:ubiquinone/menaquinone biosynthesis C-methylase UbiE
MKTYKEHSNDHDFFTKEHAAGFLRNHRTGIDNFGRQRLGHILATYDDPKVLDVACGTAVNHECWKAMGIQHQYTGLDLTQQFVEIAREKYPDADMHQGFCQELTEKFDSSSFDVVLIRHLLEHIHAGEYKETVRQALEVAETEVIIVFFLHPHNDAEDVIEERSSNIDGHSEVTHFWNTYSWPKLQSFFAELGVRVKTETIFTPGAAHADLIVRLQK